MGQDLQSGEQSRHIAYDFRGIADPERMSRFLVSESHQHPSDRHFVLADVWEINQFSGCMAEEIAKRDLKGRKVLFAGIGSGALATTIIDKEPDLFIGIDIHEPAIANTDHNFHIYEDQHGQISPYLLFQSYLLNDLVTDKKALSGNVEKNAIEDLDLSIVDDIYACLPQTAPRPEIDMSLGQSLGSYYDIQLLEQKARQFFWYEGHQSRVKKYFNEDVIQLILSYNRRGLSLNGLLLAEASRTMRKGGTVTLNLGRRPGLPSLIKLFHDFGYKVKHKDIYEKTLRVPRFDFSGFGLHEEENEGIKVELEQVYKIFEWPEKRKIAKRKDLDIEFGDFEFFANPEDVASLAEQGDETITRFIGEGKIDLDNLEGGKVKINARTALVLRQKAEEMAKEMGEKDLIPGVFEIYQKVCAIKGTKINTPFEY